MRGAEGPAFFSKKIHEKRAVTLRIDAPAGAIGRHPPPKGGEARKNPEETRSKNEIHHQAESETGGARKYRTCETIQRYIAHVEQKAQEIGEGGRLAELNLKKLEAEVALKESQGSLHRLKTAIAEGKYLPAEQATEELAEFMAAFQKFAMTIPARMAGAMSGYADAITIRNAQKAIRKELETMLTAYVDAMQAEDPPEAAP